MRKEPPGGPTRATSSPGRTEGSNPNLSSEESANFRSLSSRGALRLSVESAVLVCPETRRHVDLVHSVAIGALTAVLSQRSLFEKENCADAGD
jgi:hypothetical protein